jgi:hypothetical protein
MAKINLGRVVLGGIVAGIVADIIDYFVDGLWLAPRWADGLKALNHPAAFSLNAIVWFQVIGIVCGIVAILLYAAMRPRFGPGVKTAVYTGVVVWVLTALLPNVGFMYVTGLFGRRLTLYTTLGALVEIVVGTIAGAVLYKEQAVAEGKPVAAEKPREAVRA